jgi:hypothetical protein
MIKIRDVLQDIGSGWIIQWSTKYFVVLNYITTRMFHFSPSRFLNQAVVRTFVSLAPPSRVGAGPPGLGEIGRAVVAIVKRRRSGCVNLRV